MVKPTILVVSGTWCTTEHLEPLMQAFEAAGYSTKSVGEASSGVCHSAFDMSVEITAIRSTAIEILREGKDIIAVFHSIGSITGSQSLHGLGKSSLGNAGVKAIIHIAGILPRRGATLEEHLEVCGERAWGMVKLAFTQDDMLSMPSKIASGMFYNDVESNKAARLTELMKPQTLSVFEWPLQHDIHDEIPSGYIFTSNDSAFLYQHQLKTMEMIELPDNMKRTLSTGHLPWLTKPNEVRDSIISIANEVGTRGLVRL